MRYYPRREVGLLAKVMKRLGPRAFLSWALLVIVVLSITAGLTEAAPNLDIALVATVAAIGVSVGWAFALLPMRGGFAALLSGLFGLEFLIVRVGRLGGSLWQIIQTVGRVIWQTTLWYWTEQPPQVGPLINQYLNLWQDAWTLVSRTGRWLIDVVSGRGSFDLAGSAIAWGAVIWIYSVWAGWMLRREHRPLAGLLPGSVLMSFAISYTGSNPYLFLPVVGGALVLMALSGQQARESQWASKGIDFSQGLWSDVAVTATGISIALVIVAAISPSITIERISDWIDEVTDSSPVEERTEAVAEGLGLEQKPDPLPPRPLESARVTTLPQRHLIGSGPELSRQVTMIVETGELPELPPDELLLMDPAPRHYWRSLTYDHYFGRGWATSSTETAAYEAGEPAIPADEDADHLRMLRQKVRIVNEGVTGVVYVDGALVSVDEDFDVLWRPPGEMFAATTEVREYTADSLMSVPTDEQLRGASTDYPDWIVARYLHLPEDVPERVLVLSRDVTATGATPYDRALAIEAYLREFPYNLDVPAPGSRDDIADFFLFELQEGYCDYYATSMVVLARAAGLPARMVIGYVSGQYDPVNARYVVTEADAHAWPEIYFPEYGWVEFEPTGGRPPISRRTEQDEVVWPEPNLTQPLVNPTQPISPAWVIGQWLLLGTGGLLAVIGLLSVVDGAVLSLGTPRRMLSRLYRRLRRHASKLRVPVHKGITPLELTRALDARIRAIVGAHGFVGIELVEPAVEEVAALLSLYQAAWYSPSGTISKEARWRAIWLWWRLRWRLWLARLWRRSGLASQDRTGADVEAKPDVAAAGTARA